MSMMVTFLWKVLDFSGRNCPDQMGYQYSHLVAKENTTREITKAGK